MRGDNMIMLVVLSAASMLMLYYGSLMTPTEVYLPITPSTLRHSHPEVKTTPKLRADANICCQAETPICKACHEGISVEEYLEKQPRIMIGIPLHNRRGYVKFHSKVVTQYNNINSKDIFIFDDASTEYDEVQLRKWYGKDIHYFRSTTRLKADKNTRALFTHFAKSNYDILLTLDSDLILDNQWKQFIYDNIDKSGVLSLYHSNIGHHKTFNCNGNICQKRSMGNAGAVMTKSIVIEMLKHHTSHMFDWGWVAYFKKRGINMYVPKNSLVLHYGKIGQNNGCNTQELARGFDKSKLPSWIKTRLVFYFDKCSSPSTIFNDEVIVTSVYSYNKDPQRNRKIECNFDYIANFYNSVVFHKLNALIIHDCFPVDFVHSFSTSRIHFLLVKPSGSNRIMSTNDYRFLQYKKQLEKNLAKYYLFVDASDVFFNSNPFTYMKNNKLFISPDIGTFHKNAWQVKRCYGAAGGLWDQNLKLYNAGVWGGESKAVGCILKCVAKQLTILQGRGNCNIV